MAAWSIEKRVPSCGACEHEFADGEALWSMLAVGEEGLARRDRCAVCRTDDELDEALFWWRTHHREAKGKGLQLDLEAIEALFVALGEHEKAQDEAGERLRQLRYLMCLILLRKRRVKVVKVAREWQGREAEFFLCKRPRRDEQLAVEVFDFDAETMDALREDLQRIFEGADPNELVAPIGTGEQPEEQPGGTEEAPADQAEGSPGEPA